MDAPDALGPVLGLSLGVAGVGLLVGAGHLTVQPGAATAIAAALLASFSYGIATNYARTATAVEPFANAHGSMWGALILITPAVPFSPLPASPSVGAVASALALGILCSGMANLLYFRLIKDVGATSALTVTFLIPVFGILWGSLFLSEVLQWNTVAGAGTIIIGTALVTNFNPLALVRQKKAGGK